MNDCVSLEIAKILKEEGFNWPCDFFYAKLYDIVISTDDTTYSKVVYENLEEGDILVPSLWDAYKWLREKHNIFVNVICNSTNEWYYSISIFNSIACVILKHSENSYKTYEEALESGILKALKQKWHGWQ
jgi:hypothetical protein